MDRGMARRRTPSRRPPRPHPGRSSRRTAATRSPRGQVFGTISQMKPSKTWFEKFHLIYIMLSGGVSGGVYIKHPHYIKTSTVDYFCPLVAKNRMIPSGLTSVSVEQIVIDRVSTGGLGDEQRRLQATEGPGVRQQQRGVADGDGANPGRGLGGQWR